MQPDRIKRIFIPFFFGILLAPLFIVLHEGGHYLAAAALGFQPRLHYGEISADFSRNRRGSTLLTGAGPAAQAILAGGGFLWLYRRRHNCRTKPAGGLDWLATWMSLNVGRWLAGSLSYPLSGTQLRDEALVFRVCGIPKWHGFSCLSLLSLIVIVLTIRLHPPRSRLIPFSFACIGGLVGVNLWLRWIGPVLLP